MDTRQALIKHLALDLLHEHGLFQQGWRFEWDNGKRRAGSCNYTRKVITGSRLILPHASDEDVHETLLHEVAHALTPGHQHDAVWRRKLIELGGTGARTHNMDTPKGRYDLVCSNCGTVGHRHQKQGSWKYASPQMSPYRHRVCGGSMWLEDRKAPRALPKPSGGVTVVQIPVAASKAQETPTEGPACTCSCGGTTRGGAYLPGHDAKHLSRLVREHHDGTLTREQAMAEVAHSVKLQSKLNLRISNYAG